MSLENGLVLAAAGAKACRWWSNQRRLFGSDRFHCHRIFLFRIRERFDTVDIQAMDRFRGERR